MAFNARSPFVTQKVSQVRKGGLPPPMLAYFLLHQYTFSFTLSPTLMTLLHAALMFIAAFFAGVVNSIAGAGTLLTFPLLIWLGLHPNVANATSTVALGPGLFGG